MSSSDNSVPIEDILKQATAAELSAEAASTVPDWISQYRSPAAGRHPPLRESSSPDSDLPQPIDLRDGNVSPKEPASAKGKTAKLLEKPDNADQSREKGKSASKGLHKPGEVQRCSPKLAAVRTKAAVPTVAATLQKSGVQVAGLTGTDEAALEQRDNLLPGEIPVMLPEKLPNNKYIVELEPTGDGADSLTGDAGAVGRMLVSGKGPAADLRLDLKGVVYAAALVPSACTLAVVNISGTEARVEAMASQFLQLTRERDPAAGSARGGGDDHFMWDDDDNYQVGIEEPQKKAASKRKAQQEDAPAKKRRQTAKGGKSSAKSQSSKGTKSKAKKK